MIYFYRMKTYRLTAMIALLSLCSFALAISNWQVQDNDYTIKFSSPSATGTIKGLKGTIMFDTADLVHSRFDVTVDVHTLNTGNKLKNKHALGKGFFDVAHYPTIGFTSDSISRKAPYINLHPCMPFNDYYVYGRLRIKDVTKPIVIPFSFAQKDNKGVFRGSFTIDRKDYHLRRFLVSRMVDIELDIPVYR